MKSSVPFRNCGSNILFISIHNRLIACLQYDMCAEVLNTIYFTCDLCRLFQLFPGNVCSSVFSLHARLAISRFKRSSWITVSQCPPGHIFKRLPVVTLSNMPQLHGMLSTKFLNICASSRARYLPSRLTNVKRTNKPCVVRKGVGKFSQKFKTRTKMLIVA